ncbi:DMT family transporter [Paenibacillus humicola]|uniref:DMT family transporter n=1 Tax=Paenibacillus humicola TaxID=3110540 RepID=UPI00237B539B|nr:DMT family transporter [Paenibacillus humicola]
MNDRSVLFKLCGVSLLWGGNYVCSAYLLRDFSPVFLSFSRLVVMSLFLITVACIHRSMERPTARQWILLFFTGFFGTLMNQLFYFAGLQYSTAGNAALIIALSPIATTFLARLFLKEYISVLKFAGASLALAGVCIIVLSSGSSLDASKGDVYLLLAMLGMSASLLFIRKLTAAMSSYGVTIYSTVLGTMMMIPAASWEAAGGHLHYSTGLLSWVILVAVAVIGQGLAGFWWNKGISVVGASASAMFMNIPPFIAIVISHFVLGDPIRPSQIAGGMLILVGVAVSNKKPSPKPVIEAKI